MRWGPPRRWYDLLRRCQGDIELTFQAGKYFDRGSPKETYTFYSYIINLDDHTLEFYDMKTMKVAHPLTKEALSAPIETLFPIPRKEDSEDEEEEESQDEKDK